MKAAVMACLLALPCPVLAAPAYHCTAEVYCEAGGECDEAGIEFSLIPDGDNYNTDIDSGRISLARVSPPEAEVPSYLVASPASVTLLLTVFGDGRFVFTTHEDLNGPHVETTFGHCVPGA